MKNTRLSRIEKELEELLLYELAAHDAEVAFLGAIPKENGHHQGFHRSKVIENNAKIIAGRIIPIFKKALNEDV